MSGVMGKFLVTGIVLSSIVACSSSSDGDKPLRDPKVVKYNTRSCDYDLNAGELVTSSALNSRDITTSYFGKQFNRSYLKAIGKTSVSETIKFVNLTGATVYKAELIDTTECSRNLFADAYSMPSDIQKKWSSVTESKDNSDSFVLGLYLPKSSSMEIPSLNTGAAIIIRENTNRWTLVHEFMHHLFMVTATEQGYDQDLDRASFGAVIAELQSIFERKDLTDEQMAVLAVEPTKKYAAGLDSMMTHFTMEEMAIEATLKDEIAKGTLGYIPENSNWYIYSSARTAEEQYNNLESLIWEVYKHIPKDKYTERLAMLELSNLATKRKSEMQKISNKYPFSEQSMIGNMKFAGTDRHAGCSHQKESEEIIKLSNSVKFPTKTKY